MRRLRSSSRSIGSGSPSNSSSTSRRLVGDWPRGISMLARKMRPCPESSASFCVQYIWPRVGSTVIPTHQFDGSWRSPSLSPDWVGVSTREPPGLARIVAIAFALARLDECLNLGAIEIGAHHAHALAVRPIELATLLLEMELLWRERVPFRNDESTIAAVEIRALDRAIIPVRNAHVCPVDVARRRIDREAIGKPATGDECFWARAIGVEREDAAAQVEHEQASA